MAPSPGPLSSSCDFTRVVVGTAKAFSAAGVSRNEGTGDAQLTTGAHRGETTTVADGTACGVWSDTFFPERLLFAAEIACLSFVFGGGLFGLGNGTGGNSARVATT